MKSKDTIIKPGTLVDMFDLAEFLIDLSVLRYITVLDSDKLQVEIRAGLKPDDTKWQAKM